MHFSGKTIIVTGAASGIGRALVLECVRRGAAVVIADRDVPGAEETRSLAQELGAPAASCRIQELDVSRLDHWRALTARLGSKGAAPVDGLINNAGITFSGPLEVTDYERFEAVMSVNFMGIVYGSRELLPLLKARPEAVLTNVSSVFGLMPMKSQSAYCASKYAVRGFTEVLAQELKDSNVLVSCVYPGHIGTDIMSNALKSGNVIAEGLSDEFVGAYAREFRRGGLSADAAAAVILDGLERGQTGIAVGPDAKRAVALGRLFPRWYADRVNNQVVA